jgi:hypothetical protein
MMALAARCWEYYLTGCGSLGACLFRAWWRLKHRRGCPLPLEFRRRELLKSYQANSGGILWDVDVFDVRAACPLCRRLNRVEMKLFTPLYPHQ